MAILILMAAEAADMTGMARYVRLAPFLWHDDELVGRWAATAAEEALEEVLWGNP